MVEQIDYKGPVYIVDLNKFEKNCNAVMSPFKKEWGVNIIFGYSVKTNRDKRLIKYAYDNMGWFIEVVSPHEYLYCEDMGISRERMIFNGPCKENLIKCSSNICKCINLDNLDEVKKVVLKDGLQNSMVGVRLNFDLERKCPGETTVGREVSRFGFDYNGKDVFEAISILKKYGLKKIGLHLHTSTKTRSIDVFKGLVSFACSFKSMIDIPISFIDIGGGFFGGQKKSDKPTMEEYAACICQGLKSVFNPKETTLILEPGASVLATCVSYRTKVINKRRIRNCDIITMDGSLLHINPFMRERKQPFIVNNEEYYNRDIIARKQIVCGATCMENDRFATLINTNQLNKGDILEFLDVGAYTMAFNSDFIIKSPDIIYLEGKKI